MKMLQEEKRTRKGSDSDEAAKKSIWSICYCCTRLLLVALHSS